MSTRYVWHKMASDINKWCRDCIPCQRSKVFRHTRAPIKSFPLPSRPFSAVHLDIVGPLPQSYGFSYLLTVVDRATLWPEAWPMVSMTSKICAETFMHVWVSRFGAPDIIVTDCGAQFTSREWKNFAASLGSTAKTTSAYHPQANGLVERMHCQLKAALIARLDNDGWYKQLPWVLLGLRSYPKDDVKDLSPSELTYGIPLRLPLSLQPISVPPSASSLAAPMSFSRHGSVKTFIPKELFHATPVFDSSIQRTLQGGFEVGKTFFW